MGVRPSGGRPISAATVGERSRCPPCHRPPPAAYAARKATSRLHAVQGLSSWAPRYLRPERVPNCFKRALTGCTAWSGLVHSGCRSARRPQQFGERGRDEELSLLLGQRRLPPYFNFDSGHSMTMKGPRNQMKRRMWAVALVLPLALGAASLLSDTFPATAAATRSVSATADSSPMLAQPLVGATGFACIGAPAADPGVQGLGEGMYPERRVFLEGQSWWSDRTRHAHLGACVPADQTLSGPVTTNYRIEFHEMTGYASRMFQKVSTDTCSTCGEVETFRNSTSAAYRNDAPSSTTHWLTTTYDPAAASDHSGWQAVKQRLEIKVSDGTVRPAIRYMAYINNGKSVDHYSRAWTDAYGWHSVPKYAHSILLPATRSPYSGTVPTGSISGVYTFTVRHESTTDGVSHNITAWDVSIDPALHADPPRIGRVLGSGATSCQIGKGTCQGPTTTYKVDTTTLSNGVHWVAVFSHNIVNSAQESTGVLKFPIDVRN